MTWDVVMVQHPRACNAWSHTCHHFPEFFKEFSIKSLIDSLSWWQIFLVDYPLTVKKTTEHRFNLDLVILAFLGRGEFAVCHSRLSRFVSGSYSKIHDSSPVITRLKNSGSLSRRSRRSRHTSLRLASREVLWNHLGAHFSHVQILC